MQRTVTVVMAAFDEAPRIGRVLDVLTTYPGFKEIIVIDDASTDGTIEVVRAYDVWYARNEKNGGKGGAMERGVALAQGDVIFFCDADIAGLTHEIIDAIVRPVANGEVEMHIGMRGRKWYVAPWVMAFVPLLGGERAVTKRLWQALPSWYKQGFRIETALNFFAHHHAGGFRFRVFHGLTQVIKEKKYGLWAGLRQRFRMLAEIAFTQLTLHAAYLPVLTGKEDYPDPADRQS